MRSAISPGALVALLGLGVALTASPAAAKKSFARKEGVKCVVCHENPAGGGPRNLVGLYYHATKTLLDDRETPAAREKMEEEVAAWLERVARTPPDIRWRWTPLADLEAADPVPQPAASETAILRRISLDLRGAPPPAKDVRSLVKGEASLEELVDDYLESEDFYRTFRLYHRDLVRPRTGIFNKPPSLTMANRVTAGGAKVWTSAALPSERYDGSCNPENLVTVSPYWDREEEVKVCKRTADTRVVIEDGDAQIRCDTEEGQATGKCGCGPHLVFCYRRADRGKVKFSMVQEGARLAMEVVEKDLPYTNVLTSTWTVRNGRLDHFYARLDGTLAALEDPDVERKWRRVERDEKHAGVLTTHMYLNFFYNGRRWAQRTFETFMCHETVPDFEFFDEHAPEQPVAYRRHPLAEPDINVNSGRACAACHLQLDGLSRVKDRWTNFGQYHETNDHGPIPQSAFFLGQRVEGVAGFASALAESDVFADCVVNQAWEHLLGHRFRKEETARRRELVAKFKASDHNFRQLLRDIIATPEYRAKDALKTMEQELYWRTMERITDVKWKLAGSKKRGFDIYYDKVGGMDYRKIEKRDRSPSQGHSLVLFKGAAETCDAAVNRDYKRKDRKKRHLLRKLKSVDGAPSDAELDELLGDWFLRFQGRPWDEVAPEDRSILTRLFRAVEDEHGTKKGYKAACTALLGAEDFALY